MSFAAAMVIAMAIDAAIGWPAAVHTRIGHPVTWLGALITALDRSLNHAEHADIRRRALGLMAAVFTITLAGAAGWALQSVAPEGWGGAVLIGILAWPLIAVRAMHQHVRAVAVPLSRGDVATARAAVAMIVGRDPATLDAAGIARAATESLAENTGDGIVAPLFWGLVAGLPGIAAYKAINTLDSMIGYRTPRHDAFGWAAARIDDLANWIPARLTALLFAVASAAPRRAMLCVLSDARHHRSPNAGWPEAAMAGALNVRLSGPRVYADRQTQDPWVNAAAPDPGADTLTEALALYRRVMIGIAAILVLTAAGSGW